MNEECHGSSDREQKRNAVIDDARKWTGARGWSQHCKLACQHAQAIKAATVPVSRLRRSAPRPQVLEAFAVTLPFAQEGGSAGTCAEKDSGALLQKFVEKLRAYPDLTIIIRWAGRPLTVDKNGDCVDTLLSPPSFAAGLRVHGVHGVSTSHL